MDAPVPQASGSSMTLDKAPGPAAAEGGMEESRRMKRKRSEMGKESGQMGSSTSQSVGLVKIDPVIFGSYEIHPWFSSPYVLEQDGPPHDLTRPSSRTGSATVLAKDARASNGFGKGKSSPGANALLKDKAKDQRRTTGGRFAPNSNASSNTPSPNSSRRKSNANVPALQLSLRSRETTGSGAPPLKVPIPALRIEPPDRPLDAESPGVSSVASTAPLDSPQLRAAYEPSYVAASQVNGQAASGQSVSTLAEPSPFAGSLPLPSPPAPGPAPPLLPFSNPVQSEDAEAPSPEPPPKAPADVPSPKRPVASPQQSASINNQRGRPTSPRSQAFDASSSSFALASASTSTLTPPRGVAGRFVSQKSPEEKQAMAQAKTAKAAAAEEALKINGLMPPAVNGVEKRSKTGASRGASPVPPTPLPPTKLYVCDGCFKYMVSPHVYAQHKRTCKSTHPPGRKVYQRGAHIIWEVDGSLARLYCQCLSLFGKLFIDHKYIFFDVSGFSFYVLTEATPSFDHVLGFFSKEKVSYDGYNLACIVTFPPYQKRGFGTLLIEFSYELDRHQGDELAVAGTPERPLSDLGARGYLAFWTSVLIRYFRKVFEAKGVPTEEVVGPVIGEDGVVRRVKGFEGEIAKFSPPRPAASAPLGIAPASASTSGRPRRSKDAMAVSVRMTLGDIARATLLRPDDAAFALVKSGLATPSSSQAQQGQEGEALQAEVVVWPELVERVAERMKVKRAVVAREYVLL